MADQANTTGVGFNFDSSVLTLNNVSDVFVGAIATGNLNPEGNGLGLVGPHYLSIPRLY